MTALPRQAPSNLDGEYVWGDFDRREMEPFVPPCTTRVLEVGCGRGAFGALLKQRRPSVECWGIDPSEVSGREARERLDRLVIGTYPDDLQVEPGYFDCVVFNDVLEHIADPWAVLDQTACMLPSHGCVVASIPNVRHIEVVVDLLVRGRWTYTETGTLDRTHLRFFTKSSTRDLFEAAGLRVECLEPINTGTSHTLSARVLRRFGPLFDQFLALQYAVVARPATLQRSRKPSWRPVVGSC
jgi:2-polyprenyl-3-methyl-5-hydroxy-6-metoxy-1,4-benzoquinol methylase